MALKSASTGAFLIPTAPAVGTTVASGAANTYTTNAVQLIASTGAAIYILGLHVQLSSTSKPTYVAVRLSTGAADGSIVGEFVVPYASTAGATGQQNMGYIQLPVPIAVANATRIGCKTADSVGSLSHTVILSCINQANVVDAGINESANATQWNGTNVATTNTAGVPVVDQRSNFSRTGTAQSTGNSTTAIKLDASASATTDFYKYHRITVISGTGAPQSAICTAYDGSTKIATVSPAWPTAPDNTSVFVVSMDSQSDLDTIVGTANSTSSAQLGVNVVNWRGSAVPAPNTAGVPLADSRLVARVGTAQASGNTTTAIALDAGASSTTDYYKYHRISVISGTGAPQSAICTAYDGTTKVATVWPTWPTTPDNTSVFTVSMDSQSDIETIGGQTGAYSGGTLQVNVLQLNSSSPAAINLANHALAQVTRGTVTSGATTTSIPTSAFSINNAGAAGVVVNQFVGQRVCFLGTTTTQGLRCATAVITASTASNTPTLTVTPALPATPASGDLFTIEGSRTDLVSVVATAQTARDLGGQLDATVSSRTKPADTQARVTLVDTLTTYTGNTPQTGDSFALIGTAGVGLTNLGDARIANLDATVSSRTKPADTQARVTLVDTVTAVTGLTAANLDTTVSSRLASASYTAPDNAGIAAIETVVNANLDTTVSSRLASANIGTTLAATLGAVGRGTVTTGSSTTSVTTSALSFNGVSASGVVANEFAGRTVLFDGNTTTAGLRGAQALISANSASNTPTLTVGTLPATPASGDTFSIV